MAHEDDELHAANLEDIVREQRQRIRQLEAELRATSGGRHEPGSRLSRRSLLVLLGAGIAVPGVVVGSLASTHAATPAHVVARCKPNELLTLPITMQGVSMLPTIHNGQIVTLKTGAYLRHPPRRGDIIAFKFPLNPAQIFIKRVIGLPAENVRIAHGTVYIDGRPLREPYVSSPAFYTYGPQRVRMGEYFVLGDNRNNSYDSHLWGMLPRPDIVAKVVI